jgi:thiol-disulfide isomerase/thioredoxin
LRLNSAALYALTVVGACAVSAAPASGTVSATVTKSQTVTAAAAPAARLLNAQALRDLLGAQRGKVVILNLWATWCAPCLREIPVLINVTKNVAARGVVLVGVAMDEPQSLNTLVEPFRARFFPQFDTWLRDEPDMDRIASVVDQTWNEILPTTYIIGRNGKLSTKIQGARSEAQFRDAIEAALRLP